MQCIHKKPIHWIFQSLNKINPKSYKNPKQSFFTPKIVLLKANYKGLLGDFQGELEWL